MLHLHECKSLDHNLKQYRFNTLNIIGGDLYDHLVNLRMFALTMKFNIHMNSENLKESGYGLNLDYLTLIA